MASCAICVEDFNEKTKKPIECQYCNIKVCSVCSKKCALTWASMPKCAGCNKAFTSDHVDSMFTKAFRRGPLRIQAIQNLQEQESSLLPQTMQVIELRQKQSIYSKSIMELQELLNIFSSNPLSLFPLDKVNQIQERIKATGLTEDFYQTKRKREEPSRSVKCPKQDCLGYISSGPCAFCGTKVCKDCNVAQDKDASDHICNIEDIQTWSVIKESSKGCPKCGTRIEKVSGCNQMWCTAPGCNTAFDWTTTKIINGPIHNPHYHDWLRQGGLEVNNANFACEGPRDIVTSGRIRQLYDVYDTHFGTDGANNSLYVDMCEWLRALPETLDWRYIHAAPAVYGPDLYQDLRIAYLQGQVTKAKWASKLSHRETLRIKMARLHAIQAMFQTASADVFLKFHTDALARAAQVGIDIIKPATRWAPQRTVKTLSIAMGLPMLKVFLQAMESLRVYTNKETVKVLNDYSDSKCRLLEWHLVGSTKQRSLVFGSVDIRELNEKYLSTDASMATTD